MDKIIKSNRVKSTVDGKTIISYSKIRVGFPDVELSYERLSLQHKHVQTPGYDLQCSRFCGYYVSKGASYDTETKRSYWPRSNNAKKLPM